MSENEEPIRVLHVVTTMELGGIETLLMTIFRKIDRSKIQFDFLVHRERPGFFDEEIRALGGVVHYLPPLRPDKYFIYKKKLKYLLKNTNYSIIHSHLNANSTIVLNIAKQIGIKHRIAHSHIDQLGGTGTFLKSILMKFINKVSTDRFACSNQAGLWLYGKKNFLVFNNAIESKNFSFNHELRDNLRQKLGVDNKTVVLGNIARFNEQKNHVFMIEIFESYLKINPNSKLILIGEGDLLVDIKRKASEVGVLKNIIFTGAIKNANEYLNTMDVFLFPSLFEGLGIVAIEAQANGLPILMTNTLPKEVEVTKLVKRMSLQVSADLWANEIDKVSIPISKRSNYQQEVVNKGYDIKENVSFLTHYYLDLK